jgi:hypothetical protein
MWKECVLDATMGNKDGLFTFCPIVGDIDGDFQVVTGMNFIGAVPPKDLKMVAIVHEDGQTAVEEFCEENKDAIAQMKNINTEG